MASDPSGGKGKPVDDALDVKLSDLLHSDTESMVGLQRCECGRCDTIRNALTVIVAAKRMVGAYSREVTARAQWAEKSEPWSPESKAMFQTVLDRECETANFAIELGRLLFEDAEVPNG